MRICSCCRLRVLWRFHAQAAARDGVAVAAERCADPSTTEAMVTTPVIASDPYCAAAPSRSISLRATVPKGTLFVSPPPQEAC
jgi:hypothetical protein